MDISNNMHKHCITLSSLPPITRRQSKLHPTTVCSFRECPRSLFWHFCGKTCVAPICGSSPISSVLLPTISSSIKNILKTISAVQDSSRWPCHSLTLLLAHDPSRSPEDTPKTPITSQESWTKTPRSACIILAILATPVNYWEEFKHPSSFKLVLCVRGNNVNGNNGWEGAWRP